MKEIKILIAILISGVFFLAGCKSKSGSANTDNGNNGTATVTADASSPGSGSFSANLDGAAIFGGKIDELQLQNTAFLYPTAYKSGKRLLFHLFSDKKGTDTYAFMFSVPGKTGSFTKNIHDGQAFDITLDFLGRAHPSYSAQSITVNITSVTASRVTGTFSGKFIITNDTADEPKKQAIVTDGKFDIPFSTGNAKWE